MGKARGKRKQERETINFEPTRKSKRNIGRVKRYNDDEDEDLESGRVEVKQEVDDSYDFDTAQSLLYDLDFTQLNEFNDMSKQSDPGAFDPNAEIEIKEEPTSSWRQSTSNVCTDKKNKASETDVKDRKRETELRKNLRKKIKDGMKRHRKKMEENELPEDQIKQKLAEITVLITERHNLKYYPSKYPNLKAQPKHKQNIVTMTPEEKRQRQIINGIQYRASMTAQQRREKYHRDCMWRIQNKAKMTPEEIRAKKDKINENARKKFASREARDARNKKQRDYLNSKGPEEKAKHLEAMKKWATAYYRKRRKDPAYRKILNETARKFLIKEAESPEKRQKRLLVYKVNQAKRNLRKKLTIQGVSEEEIEKRIVVLVAEITEKHYALPITKYIPRGPKSTTASTRPVSSAGEAPVSDSTQSNSVVSVSESSKEQNLQAAQTSHRAGHFLENFGSYRWSERNYDTSSHGNNFKQDPPVAECQQKIETDVTNVFSASQPPPPKNFDTFAPPSPDRSDDDGGDDNIDEISNEDFEEDKSQSPHPPPPPQTLLPELLSEHVPSQVAMDDPQKVEREDIRETTGLIVAKTLEPIPPTVEPTPFFKIDKPKHARVVCDECGISMVKFHLQRHKQMVHNADVPLLKCPECPAKFRRNESLWCHFKTYHGKGDGDETKVPPRRWGGPPAPRKEPVTSFCDYCGKTFKSKCYLDDHIRRVHQGMKFICNVCNREFQSGGKLWWHQVTAHNMTDLPSPVPLIECEYCGDKMLRGMEAHVKRRHPEKLAEYIKAHAGDPKRRVTPISAMHNKIVKCPKCSKDLRQQSLANHMRVMHAIGENTPYTCVHCGRNFSRQYHLDRHVNSVHDTIERKTKLIKHVPLQGKLKPMCTICEISFGGKSELHQHLVLKHPDEVKRSESDDLPCLCEECGEGFALEIDLVGHMGSVHPDASFACPECSQMFPSKELKEHMITQHGECVNSLATNFTMYRRTRSLCCTVCNARPTTIEELYAHFHKEHPTSPCFWPCDYCHKIYNSENGLLFHLQMCLGKKRRKADDNIASDKKYGDKLKDMREKMFSACEFCGVRVFLFSLKIHYENKHGLVENLWKCDLCLLEFPRREYWVQHMNKGHGQDIFELIPQTQKLHCSDMSTFKMGRRIGRAKRIYKSKRAKERDGDDGESMKKKAIDSKPRRSSRKSRNTSKRYLEQSDSDCDASDGDYWVNSGYKKKDFKCVKVRVIKLPNAEFEKYLGKST